MPRHVPLLAALSLSLLGPVPASGPSHLPSVVAQRDSSFVVADSVGALLSYVTSLAVDDEGILYLADYRLSAILKFDPTGGFLGTIGRSGSGPGEFYTVFLVGLHRDSLWAVDPGLVRLTLFPRRGPGATTVPVGSNAPFSPLATGPRVRSGMPMAVLADGTLLFQESVRDSSSPTGALAEFVLVRGTRSLEVLDTIVRYPMTHSGMDFVYRDGEAHLGQPFGDDPLYAVAHDGSILVVVDRPAPRRGSVPGVFRVTAWADGRVKLFSREISYQPRRLPGRVVDSLVDRLVGSGGRDAPRSPITADSVHRHLYRPAYYPPVKEVQVGHDGSIWLQVNFAESPDTRAEWLRLSRHGFEMERVVLPLHFRLLEEERRSLWGVEGDVDDVPLLRRYLLPRGAAL
jgi:hypothetical protein